MLARGLRRVSHNAALAAPRPPTRQLGGLRKRPPSPEALSLYRDCLRAARHFHWADQNGEPWNVVLRRSTRKEFEQAHGRAHACGRPGVPRQDRAAVRGGAEADRGQGRADADAVTVCFLALLRVCRMCLFLFLNLSDSFVVCTREPSRRPYRAGPGPARATAGQKQLRSALPSTGA